jgi:hypothetical protein
MLRGSQQNLGSPFLANFATFLIFFSKTLKIYQAFLSKSKILMRKIKNIYLILGQFKANKYIKTVNLPIENEKKSL